MDLKEALFDEKANPSIRFFKKACAWAMLNTPDLTNLTGWKKWAMRFFYIYLILGTSSLVIQTGFSLGGIIYNSMMLIFVVGLININFIATSVYSFLAFWETLKEKA